jgi:acyl transferase domain-containing protein
VVIVEILKSWGIHPSAVVGHSSGEIAAAYCAGHLSMEDAVKAAFYRGQASVQVQTDSRARVGMLAVGTGAEEVLKYLGGLESLVEVACYNSPNGVTLSGSIPALKEVKARLEEGSHFARILHVDLAYHSKYMKGISDVYKSLLDQDFLSRPFSSGRVKMFSSVLGRELDRATDSKYWHTNMASPVIFDQAVREMISGRGGADFLIEIGPSCTLAGPIAEIKRTLPQEGSHIQYCTAFQRRQEDLKSLFEVAGRLFISGAAVDMSMVNRQNDGSPSVIVDLPNYVWNHSTQYWYESEASKDWRYRLFPHHDMIGSKVLGTSYYAPVWKKALKVDDLPWLKDHKVCPYLQPYRLG